MHPSSLRLMESFRDEFLAAGPLEILDVGSQDINGTYRHLFDRPGWNYCGLDIAPGQNVDVVVSDYYYWTELSSESVDVVISGQAFEHIEYPWLTIGEIARILKSGGLACIIAPSKGPEHRYPVDCWRIYRDGMRALAKFAGLEPLRVTIDEQSEWGDCIAVLRR